MSTIVKQEVSGREREREERSEGKREGTEMMAFCATSWQMVGNGTREIQGIVDISVVNNMGKGTG